jgi:hypothetical protein
MGAFQRPLGVDFPVALSAAAGQERSEVTPSKAGFVDSVKPVYLHIEAHGDYRWLRYQKFFDPMLADMQTC